MSRSFTFLGCLLVAAASGKAAAINFNAGMSCTGSAYATVSLSGSVAAGGAGGYFTAMSATQYSVGPGESCTFALPNMTAMDWYVITGRTGTGILASAWSRYQDLGPGLLLTPPEMIVDGNCWSSIGNLYCPFTFGVPFTLGVTRKEVQFGWTGGSSWGSESVEAMLIVRDGRTAEILTDITITQMPEPCSKWLAFTALAFLFVRRTTY